MSKAKDSGKEPRTSIQIKRTFGMANLLDLYSEYVAKKICEEMKNN